MKEYITHSEGETEALAAQIATLLRPGDLLAYQGGMGMGKTAFTRGLAKGLGITDWVSSPTFGLVNEYRHGPIPLFHFDFYQIADFEDLVSTGFFDYLEEPGIFAVEWSEQVPTALPFPHITLCFERLGEDDRRIVIKGDERF